MRTQPAEASGYALSILRTASSVSCASRRRALGNTHHRSRMSFSFAARRCRGCGLTHHTRGCTVNPARGVVGMSARVVGVLRARVCALGDTRCYSLAPFFCCAPVLPAQARPLGGVPVLPSALLLLHAGLAAVLDPYARSQPWARAHRGLGGLSRPVRLLVPAGAPHAGVAGADLMIRARGVVGVRLRISQSGRRARAYSAGMTIRRRGYRCGSQLRAGAYVHLGGLAGARRRYSGLCCSGGQRDAIAGVRIRIGRRVSSFCNPAYIMLLLNPCHRLTHSHIPVGYSPYLPTAD